MGIPGRAVLKLANELFSLITEKPHAKLEFGDGMKAGNNNFIHR
jgi:hypothetical protein